MLKWLRTNTDMPFDVLLKAGGPLADAFAAIAPVTCWSDQWTFNADDYGLIYTNTITNGDVLATLDAPLPPVITHAHEMDYWIQYRLDEQNKESTLAHTTHYVAVSKAVQSALERLLQIPCERISVINECIRVPDDPGKPDAALQRKLGIPDDAMIVGGSGTTDWRKAPDLFIQLAGYVQRLLPDRPVHFLWVGGANQGPVWGKLRHDAQRIGLQDRVHFTGHVENPMAYYRLFDVFAMVSREDPFPLVNLEAGALGIPTVCFKGSGGSEEYVEAGGGLAVPYLDLPAMADRMAGLLCAPDKRNAMGTRARETVRSRYDVSVIAPRIAKLIKAHMRNDR
jgi:glycosyltransferase involved in cell wall biosynthesis